jgi:imidazoleglycerol-phosphate dehydratase/histidinol-phosphatase
MKKALFIDRDGTLIVEPEDFVIDSLEKLTYLPGVFFYLGLIARQLDYELIMVTNQDGLGTEVFPEDTFWPAHQKMMEALSHEGIQFKAVHIDPHFEHDGSDTRKPGTGMLKSYMDGSYDLSKSFVIGDRITDVQLAKNLGAKGILISDEDKSQAIHEQDLSEDLALIASGWREIYVYLKSVQRRASIHRKTNETDIRIELALDGSGQTQIHTGLGFFDHMLEQIGRHSGIDLSIQVKGDLHIDEHHTIEDTALALGAAFKEALGNKVGIERYGFTLPMDDCLATVAIDFGGRPWIVWDATFQREKIGDCPTEMFFHFFKSFSDAAACNLNIKVEGQNEHHKIEAIFKGFAKAIRQAIRQDYLSHTLPTTKGLL